MSGPAPAIVTLCDAEALRDATVWYDGIRHLSIDRYATALCGAEDAHGVVGPRGIDAPPCELCLAAFKRELGA